MQLETLMSSPTFTTVEEDEVLYLHHDIVSRTSTVNLQKLSAADVIELQGSRSTSKDTSTACVNKPLDIPLDVGD